MDSFTKYDDVLRYMYAHLPMYQRQGASAFKKDLTNILLLCEALGNPHLKLKTVHVAGTNGKGTVSHIIAAGLQIQGLKIGLYTSPHYKDFRERIKINGSFIGKAYLKKFINTYKDLIEEIQPSFFEITVALAFKWFADEEVDIAVIEVGLGGRLDSTNVITPLLSVITNISFDHMDMLGHTLPEIASEKAGIIKKGIPVIVGERQEEVIDIFLAKALELNSPLIRASDAYSLKILSEKDDSKIVSIFKNGSSWIDSMDTDLIAPFHSKNLVTAFAALDVLSHQIKLDFAKITKDFIRLRSLTYYIGRWQIIAHRPTVMIDSAHNEGGLQYVMDMLNLLDVSKLHIILGFVNDKDLSKVLPLFPRSARYYFAKANIPRGLGAEKLRDEAKGFGLDGKSYSSVKMALSAAKKSCKIDDFIFVGGSIFVVAEVL